eukprot:182594-Pyramimonas_sp.AAC.1
MRARARTVPGLVAASRGPLGGVRRAPPGALYGQSGAALTPRMGIVGEPARKQLPPALLGA